MFESIFTSTADNSINISQAAISLGASIVMGVIIAIVYMYICKKFSMAGAFALVRFRSAPGSAKDISIVFFTMAAGLACGLGYVTFAAAFTAVMLLLLILISAFGFADRNEGRKQLKIVIPESLNYNSVFDDLFDKYTSENRLNKVKTTNMGTMYELTYEIRLKNDDAEKDFIDELRVRNGNLNISVGIMPENSVSALN